MREGVAVPVFETLGLPVNEILAVLQPLPVPRRSRSPPPPPAPPPPLLPLLPVPLWVEVLHRERDTLPVLQAVGLRVNVGEFESVEDGLEVPVDMQPPPWWLLW